LTDRPFSKLNQLIMASHTRSKEEVVQEFRIQTLQEAAMRVIGRKGIAAATMQDIAEEAGVAKGTIYLYFKDRDELVESTFETTINQLDSRIEAAMAAESNFEAKFRAGLKTLFAFFRENREFFRLFTAHRFPEGTPHQQRRQQRHCDRYRERTEKFAAQLSAAMDSGEIRRMDPQRLAMFVIEGTNALVIQRVTTEDTPPPEGKDVDLIVDIVFGGIRATRSEK
jgi:AcrR family transcriptional regulator